MDSYLGVDGDVLRDTGYTDDEFVELDPVHDFLSPKADRAKLTSLFESMVDPDQSFVEVDIPYLHKDGQTIWLRACQGSRVIGTAENGKAKVLLVFRDVTSQHTVSASLFLVSNCPPLYHQYSLTRSWAEFVRPYFCIP